MKNLKVISLTIFSVTLLITTGCQPKLAESPYGAREKQWEDFIKETYPDWEPPQTVPPERVVTAPPASTNAPQIIAEEEMVIEDANTPQIDPVIADENIETAEKEVTAEFQSYVVQKGDTLWSISRKFYGSGKNWRAIFKANQDVMSAPDKVRAGTELKIPSNQ
jgi:LysM repeat protein